MGLPALMRIEVLRQDILDRPLELGGGEALRLRFSAGVAGTSEEPEPVTPKALVSRADRRLLVAKRAGRGRCVGPAAVEVSGPST
jgi:PleD family two-component response regulator